VLHSYVDQGTQASPERRRAPWLPGRRGIYNNDGIEDRSEEAPLTLPSKLPTYLIDGSRFNSLIIGSALGVDGSPPYTDDP
jgi:hypothetical protein